MPGPASDRTTHTELDMAHVDAKDEGTADHVEALEERNHMAMDSGDQPTFDKRIQKSAMRKVCPSS